MNRYKYGTVKTMNTDPRRYRMDYDWLWTNPPHNDGTPATVRLHLEPAPRKQLAQFADHVEGGWFVTTNPEQGTVDITSAGEDVADGIEAGTDFAFDTFIQGTNLSGTWEQLPRTEAQ